MLTSTIGKGKYGSDLVVDLMQRYEIPYVALNPGSTFRGLHDSLVNYGGNRPEIILAQHEKIAVQIAHGYAKASGRPWRRSRTIPSACCMRRTPSTTHTSTAPRSSSWAPRAPWISAAAARISTGSTRRCCSDKPSATT